jgi:hypothetical protein
MKVALSALISSLLAVILQTGCVSIDAGSRAAASPDPAARETPAPKENVKTGETKRSINLQLSAKETSCVRPAPCKILLDIENLSDEDINMELSLNINLRPYSTEPRRDLSHDLHSPLNIDTLENLQPNQYSRFLIKGHQHIEKEIDLEKIKWLRSIQSSWHYYDLWEQVTEGKYRVSAGLEENPKLIDPRRIKKDVKATKAVGQKDVTFVNIEPILSITANSLMIDLKEKL